MNEKKTNKPKRGRRKAEPNAASQGKKTVDMQDILFVGRSGLRINLSLEGALETPLPAKLRGPHGRRYELLLQYVPGQAGLADIAKLTQAQRKTLDKLLKDGRLSDSERGELREASLVIKDENVVAARNGPIVRFDCTWLGWD
jgi:hypothetical protein